MLNPSLQKASFLLTALIVSACPAFAQECASVYRDAIANVDVDVSARTEANYAYSLYCEENGETKSYFAEGSVGFPVYGIPVSLSASGKFDSSQMRAFCSTASQQGASTNQDFGYQRYVVTDALTSFNQCVNLENDGVLVTHEVAAPESFIVFIKLKGVTNKGKLLSLQYQSDKISCNYNTPNGDHRELTDATATVPANSQGENVVRHILDVDISLENIIVNCGRKPFSFEGGAYYPRATFQMGTSWGPYTVILPEDTHYGFEMASQAQATFAEQSKRIADLAKSRQDWKTRSERFETRVRELQLLHVYQGDNVRNADYRFSCPQVGGPVIDRAFMTSLCQGRGSGMVYRAHRPVILDDGGPCGHTMWALICLPK
jgi:hypothetical protein